MNIHIRYLLLAFGLLSFVCGIVELNLIPVISWIAAIFIIVGLFGIFISLFKE